MLPALGAQAQDLLPDAPRPKTAHHFLDTETKIELAASAVSISLDGLSTMKVMAYQRKPYHLSERNPIARPFMNKRPLAAAYFATAFVGEVAAVRFADKKGWKKTKRLIPIAVTLWESVLTFENYRYVHRASARNNCIIANPVTPAGVLVSPCALIE
jgi:hypothetical protein